MRMLFFGFCGLLGAIAVFASLSRVFYNFRIIYVIYGIIIVSVVIGKILNKK